MPDRIKEIVKPSGEVAVPSIHPDVSPHVETAGDIEHLGRIHAELSGEGAKITGELTQIQTEPRDLDSSQFEEPKSVPRVTSATDQAGSQDDTPSWRSKFAARKKEKEELKRAA